MRLTFRLKVVLLLTTGLLALVLMIVGSEIIDEQLRSERNRVRARLVPRTELALKLDASFVALARSLQDAVSAQDRDALSATKEQQRRVLELIEDAGPALEPRDAAALRSAIEEYFLAAHQVSARLIEGETGEEALLAIADMQRKQKKAERMIEESTSVRHGEMDQAFGSLERATRRSSHFRMMTGAIAVLLMLALWVWASRQMLRGLGSLSAGLNSFATGDFGKPIVITSRDELGDLTRAANSMASNLQRLAEERDEADWLKSGQVELSLALRGNQVPGDVARHAMHCLVQRTGAVAATIYLKSEDGALESLGAYAQVRETPASEVPQSRKAFGPGEGLVGQVGVQGEARIVRSLPRGYLELVSGLGQSPPQVLVLFPLKSEGETVAVVELALFEELNELSRMYVASVEDALVAALLAARARQEVDRLLEETRGQADQLAQQEEELRLNNQELFSQQEELRVANTELERKQFALEENNRALDRARTREQEKAEELGRVSLYKSQFLANMSHELRTPLNSMLLLSHLLSENSSQNLTDKQVQHCATIHSAGQELLELINQVLDLAKIEAGKQEVDVALVPLEPLIEKLQRMFEPLAKEKSLSFSVALDALCPVQIYTDRSRLERILINLLGNAIKFTEVGHVKLLVAPPPPNVTFPRTELDSEKTIAFTVVDSGIGIPAAELSRVFSPFEQVEATSARRYEGSGLGLTIARESAVLLGGELCAESEPGKGSTFTCYLPKGSASQASERLGELRVMEAACGIESPNPSSDLILVVEDDALLAEQLVELIRDRGLEALVTDRGERGLTLAAEKQPRGIVLDVKLPDIDGWTVMERLKASPATKDIPVHFLSALDAPESGFNRGAIGYLTKPANRDQLKELIETLAPAGAKNSKILVVEDSVVEGQSIVALLESADLQATHVTSAKSATAALEKERYGCMVLDLGLEETDGLRLLETLSKKPDFVGTGVIIHTGRSLTRKETHRLQTYAQAIVMKDGSSSARLLEEIRLFIHHVRGAARPPPPTDPAARVSFSGTRILVVEDDMRTVYSLSALLQSRGCEVLVAENGREALTILEGAERVSCVLMDIMMPEMDGYETMRHMRSAEATRDLPVIVLTAKAMKGERERCIEAGASDYLTKPVNSEQLFAALVRWTRPTEVSSAI